MNDLSALAAMCALALLVCLVRALQTSGGEQRKDSNDGNH